MKDEWLIVKFKSGKGSSWLSQRWWKKTQQVEAGMCAKAVASKIVGYAIIAFSAIVKIPQIMKMWNNGSAQGVSFINILTDLYAITMVSSYSFRKGFPISAYGEGILLGLQTLIISSQVLFYNASSLASAAFIAIYSVICYCTAGGLVPIDVLWNLQITVLPIMFLGKLIQAHTNYKNQSTGQLSAITMTSLFLGAVARVLTSIQETGDKMLILTYSVSTIGNALIVFQLFYYRKPASKPKKKKEGKKKQ